MINCQFENGIKASLRHTTCTTIAYNQKKTKILLIKRASFLINPNKYALPGGFLGRNETTKECAIRETLEETGYLVEIIKLFRINDNPNRPQEDRQNIDFIYLAQVLKKVNKFDKEQTSAGFFNLNKLPKKEFFAFDHYENIKLFIKYCEKPFSLPLI